MVCDWRLVLVLVLTDVGVGFAAAAGEQHPLSGHREALASTRALSGERSFTRSPAPPTQTAGHTERDSAEQDPEDQRVAAHHRRADLRAEQVVQVRGEHGAVDPPLGVQQTSRDHRPKTSVGPPARAQ